MRSGQSESDESAGLLNLQGGYNCQCMPSRVVAEPSHGETPEKDPDQKAGHRPGYYTNIHLLQRQHSTQYRAGPVHGKRLPDAAEASGTRHARLLL